MKCSNAVHCPCPKTKCSNHGKCCDCVLKHKNTDSLPYCLFDGDGGKKSNENYYRFLKKRFSSPKAKVIDEKCCGNKNNCSVLNICPLGAISFVEVAQAIERNVQCKPKGTSNCGCAGDCATDSSACETNPYGRVVIDQNRCNGCGICVKECCGDAIEV